MIIRETPKELDKFVCVNSTLSLSLQRKGFEPMYIDENGIYYKKTKELMDKLVEEYC